MCVWEDYVCVTCAFSGSRYLQERHLAAESVLPDGRALVLCFGEVLFPVAELGLAHPHGVIGWRFGLGRKRHPGLAATDNLGLLGLARKHSEGAIVFLPRRIVNMRSSQSDPEKRNNSLYVP